MFVLQFSNDPTITQQWSHPRVKPLLVTPLCHSEGCIDLVKDTDQKEKRCEQDPDTSARDSTSTTINIVDDSEAVDMVDAGEGNELAGDQQAACVEKAKSLTGK